ncbi:MAG: sugar nucleotide-binding protein, partial [Lentisphaeria bacterium]|nr:sugar nucleotide-binding protein [Lentisphaeria bacterium]
MSRPPNTIVLLGGGGMLGTDLAAALQVAGMTPVVLDLPECDVTNADHLRAALTDVDAVVNCAAFTNVDGAETARETAHAVNAEAPGVLGHLARERGVHVLHIGTDFVFDGHLDRPYGETDTTSPLSVYGTTKL